MFRPLFSNICLMYISQTNSTNDYLKQHAACDAVWTSWQTAGRGQAGNSWESEKGKNVLLSLRFRKPEVSVEQQFRLTMAVSLGVYDVVSQLLPNEATAIKWPNDIYIGDRKVCGILIENTITGNRIAETIAGVGLNVNQTLWQTDAPNPISLRQVSGVDYDLPAVYERLCETIIERLALLKEPEKLKQYYLDVLYRMGVKALYARREVNLTPSRVLTTQTPEAFEATISDVTDQGELVLDNQQKFHFKEIQFVL